MSKQFYKVNDARLTSFKKFTAFLLAFFQTAMKTVDFLSVLLQLTLVGFLQRSNLSLEFIYQLLLCNPCNTL